MKKRKTLLAIGAPLLVLALYFALRPEQIQEPVATAAATPDETAGADLPAPPRGSRPSATAVPMADAELVAQLRSRYGANIRSPYVQIKLIEALVRHFQKQDPLHWREALLAAVRAAFPDRYDEIAKNLDNRLAYERWINENRARLDGLDPEERRAAIREERNRLFGEEAADEIWASEQKNQAVADTLKEIDGLPGKGLGDKLTTYTERLEEIYEEQYDTYLENHRHEVMNRFLSLESVQAELDAMSAAARAESLREIRKGMGLDDAALARWDTLDHDRDARWENGKKYMAERKALTEAYSGKVLEQKLAELRRRYFGDEAEVIAAEEESGFFRFDRPRRWGQN
ncbi:hypothetical protein [Polyangium sp. 15x6]|uniref:hypothetical protein n=1 Tax=Polyangium sp. 15x6 TaxID=3042687 RepID=UPI00249CE366|nr:hypothetical protein [Polyangium sp. 15x6]MDI3285792.1 hypothetical protein [Polyangium sp. 15x6]